jgi:hypothetical protein
VLTTLQNLLLVNMFTSFLFLLTILPFTLATQYPESCEICSFNDCCNITSPDSGKTCNVSNMFYSLKNYDNIPTVSECWVPGSGFSTSCSSVNVGSFDMLDFPPPFFNGGNTFSMGSVPHSRWSLYGNLNVTMVESDGFYSYYIRMEFEVGIVDQYCNLEGSCTWSAGIADIDFLTFDFYFEPRKTSDCPSQHKSNQGVGYTISWAASDYQFQITSCMLPSHDPFVTKQYSHVSFHGGTMRDQITVSCSGPNWNKWFYGDWNECQQNSQHRNVFCKNPNGVTIPNTHCPSGNQPTQWKQCEESGGGIGQHTILIIAGSVLGLILLCCCMFHCVKRKFSEGLEPLLPH